MVGIDRAVEFMIKTCLPLDLKLRTEKRKETFKVYIGSLGRSAHSLCTVQSNLSNISTA